VPELTAESRFAEADRILREASGRRFTAAVLRVERRGTLAFERAYGAVDDRRSAPLVDGATRFDLASLTKVFVATAALRSVASGRLCLDAPLVDVVPEWRGLPHEAITLRTLLAHTSGMQSGADYRSLLGENVEEYAMLRPLAADVGTRVIYSDLGFIALGVVLARAARASLARVVEEACDAIGAGGTAFRPAPRTRDEIPATEEDGWRGRLRGEVHDEKAYLLNGVAGHAGLFGSALDVARLAEAYLGPIRGRPERGLPAALATEAVKEAGHDPVLRRGLGWALKTSDENSCGSAMTDATFGHTGFTGTCMWADPTRDLSIVLLTNAVYYGRTDIRDLRAAVCDATVAEAR
jgi:CubicO group peptidase (beta-lactamase class C family)